MLVGINTHKNSYRKPVHPLLTAGKTEIYFFIYFTGFFNCQIQVQDLGKQWHCCHCHQRKISACTSHSSLSPSSIRVGNWLFPPWHAAEDSGTPAAVWNSSYCCLTRYQKNMKLCETTLQTLFMLQNAPAISDQGTVTQTVMLISYPNNLKGQKNAHSPNRLPHGDTSARVRFGLDNTCQRGDRYFKAKKASQSPRKREFEVFLHISNPFKEQTRTHRPHRLRISGQRDSQGLHIIMQNKNIGKEIFIKKY